MRPKSQTLFHFTKSVEILKSIFINGFWPKYCLEDLSWYFKQGEGYIAFPTVCFCDIPLSRIKEHVSFYGEFGIGMTKEWALSNGLNPVSYLTTSSNYGNAINNLFHNHTGQDTFYSLSGLDMNMILSNIKPLEGNMIIAGKIVKKEFYQENEWRYSPRNKNIDSWLQNDQFNDLTLLSEKNEKTKNFCSLKISPSDVKYIFVKKDSDIPEIINFIQSELDHYSNSDIKILMSRVISLESISSDI